jgi:hypothetical protein
VNGPLQQRTNVLDLDSSRATTFPIDYDTDLEFEWSNLSKILIRLTNERNYFEISYGQCVLLIF